MQSRLCHCDEREEALILKMGVHTGGDDDMLKHDLSNATTPPIPHAYSLLLLQKKSNKKKGETCQLSKSHHQMLWAVVLHRNFWHFTC